MALTKSFEDLVQRRMASDPAFGDALLCEGIGTMLTGEFDTGNPRASSRALNHPALNLV